MKKLTSLLLVILLLAALPLSAMALVGQSESYYVCDDAGVLSERLEQKIVESNALLEEECEGAQIVVVSVAYTDGLYADEYAYALMNDWGVGSGEKDNGMLLLFATRENRAWLAVGDGIFKSFDEDVASMYLDYFFWDDYDAEDYESAVETLFNALVQWYADCYGVGSIDTAQPHEQIVYHYDHNDYPYYYSEPTFQEKCVTVITNILALAIFLFITLLPFFLFSLAWNRIRWQHWGIWPFCIFRPWWRTRRSMSAPPPIFPFVTTTYHSTNHSHSHYHSGSSHSSFGSSSSHSSFGGSSHHPSGGSHHSSGSGRGGGGRSGGGAGRR